MQHCRNLNLSAAERSLCNPLAEDPHRSHSETPYCPCSQGCLVCCGLKNLAAFISPTCSGPEPWLGKCVCWHARGVKSHRALFGQAGLPSWQGVKTSTLSCIVRRNYTENMLGNWGIYLPKSMISQGLSLLGRTFMAVTKPLHFSLRKVFKVKKNKIELAAAVWSLRRYSRAWAPFLYLLLLPPQCP